MVKFSENRFAALMSSSDDDRPCGSRIRKRFKGNLDKDPDENPPDFARSTQTTKKKVTREEKRKRRMKATNKVPEDTHKPDTKPAQPSKTPRGQANKFQAQGSVLPERVLPGRVIVETLESSTDGAVAQAGKVVQIEFSGFLDGEKYRGTKAFERGIVDFVLGDKSLVPGLHTGVMGMRVGERRLIRVPSKLAYGRKGVPPKIPHNADLRFEVRLKFTGVDWEKVEERKRKTGKEGKKRYVRRRTD